jgi:rubrerythrin
VVAGGDGFLRDALSRRCFLGIAGAGISGALVAGCGDDTKSAAAGTTPDESDAADVELLNSVLDLELELLAAYKAGAARLRGSNLRTAKGFIEQEQEHVDALAAAIRELSGTPNEPKAAYEFPRLRSEHAAMRFAVDLENTVIAAYVDALPKFSQADLRSTAAAILTCEAEHVAVLLGALGRPQAPAAFVAGRAA